MEDNIALGKTVSKDSKEFKEGIARLRELTVKSREVYKKEREAAALWRGSFEAKERILDTEIRIYKDSLKSSKVLSKRQAHRAAKKEAFKATTKDRLGLTQGDDIISKQGLRNTGSMALQGGLHAMGVMTENPLFNLAAHALGKRRQRVTEARRETYEHEENQKVQK